MAAFRCPSKRARVPSSSYERFSHLFVSFNRHLQLEVHRQHQTPSIARTGPAGCFVPPAQYQGPDVVACRACGSTTRGMCRDAAHDGICPQDVGMQQAISLAVLEDDTRL
ncbi:hypothetical protein F5Y07DRAFT_355806, partial [Xylaria sp. FL0933]